MPTEEPDLPKLLSVPGLMAIGIFGISVIVVSRLFGSENILREIVTELLASFGSTILLFAIFGFFFRTGLQRLLRWAPGGGPSRNPRNALESFCKTSTFEGA